MTPLQKLTSVPYAMKVPNQPGIAQGRNPGFLFLTESAAMTTIVTVTITIPTSGYVYLHGRAYFEFSDFPNHGYGFLQINDAPGASRTPGVFSLVGLPSFDTGLDQYFDCNAQRTYFKSAGTHTFYLAGNENSQGLVEAGYAILTAMFFPTSYGTVTTIASWPGDNPEATAITAQDKISKGSFQTIWKMDLRYYELKAKEARIRALKADRELELAP